MIHKLPIRRSTYRYLVFCGSCLAVSGVVWLGLVRTGHSQNRQEGNFTAFGSNPNELEESGRSPTPSAGVIGMKFSHCVVVAPETFEVAVQETGVIAELSISENSHVVRGEQVGRLDSETVELEEQVAALQYQVASAEAKDESDIRFAEIVVEETRLQLDAFEEMGRKGDASLLEVRQKRIAWEQAKVKVIQAKAAKAQKELKAKLAQASYALSQKKIARLRFVSPADGVVTRVDHRTGEWVPVGTPVFKVVRMDEVRVDFFVDLGAVQPGAIVGTSVIVHVDRAGRAGDVKLPGRITGYLPEVSSKGSVRMSATVVNQKFESGWTLLPGMTVGLKLTEKSSPVRTLAPSSESALQERSIQVK